MNGKIDDAHKRQIWEDELDRIRKKYTEDYDDDDQDTRDTKGRIIDALKRGYEDEYGEAYPEQKDPKS